MPQIATIAQRVGVNNGGTDGKADVDAPQRLMWLNADRAVYCGLLGRPTVRRLGGYAIYLSPRGSHRIQVETGSWQAGSLSVVPPYVDHRVATDEPAICKIVVEAETVDVASLPGAIQRARGVIVDRGLIGRVQRVLAETGRSSVWPPQTTGAFDGHFFGGAVVWPQLDPRIQAVVDQIKADPTAPLAARDCAARHQLSESRFLHLFRQEVGIPFRRFKTWKRARTMLYYVTQDFRLTDIALDIGYPDATHFSHSIRQIYGLTPRSIFEGSRRLSLYGDTRLIGDGSYRGRA